LAIPKDVGADGDVGVDGTLIEASPVFMTLFSALCEFASLADNARLDEDVQHLMRPFGVLASSVLNQLLSAGASTQDAARLRGDCALLPADMRAPMLARVASSMALTASETTSASAS
jgi:hypothetical protein